MDVAQELEDVLEELVSIQKAINKLTTASVSGAPLRKRVKDTHKAWLPVSGSSRLAIWLTLASCKTCRMRGLRSSG
jgi:hypothetical protein